MAQPENVICAAVENRVRCTRESTVIDHIRPHKGVWVMFMDRNNLQGLCARHHSQKTATEDGGFNNRRTA